MHSADQVQLRDFADRYARQASSQHSAPRGPRRLTLDAARQQKAVTETRLAKIDQLLDEKRSESWRLRELRDKLQLRLNAARENEARRAVDAFINGGGSDEKSAADYQKALDDVTREYVATKDLVSNLERERQAAERELSLVKIDLDNALGQFLSHSPAVFALFEHYNRLRREVASLAEALKVVALNSGTPETFRYWQAPYSGETDETVARDWKAAVDKLKRDASQKLPEVK
jgi:hypothetical protein